ncbi:MAG: hypothetical protein J0H41_16695 [Rhizobiales bacterium]|nr:hypothetical protein [Hyphomicrobiales bacterium]
MDIVDVETILAHLPIARENGDARRPVLVARIDHRRFVDVGGTRAFLRFATPSRAAPDETA